MEKVHDLSISVQLDDGNHRVGRLGIVLEHKGHDSGGLRPHTVVVVLAATAMAAALRGVTVTTVAGVFIVTTVTTSTTAGSPVVQDVGGDFDALEELLGT